MPNEVGSLYEELCARGIVSRNDISTRTACSQAEALVGMSIAIGRFSRFLYRSLLPSANGWAQALSAWRRTEIERRTFHGRV